MPKKIAMLTAYDYPTALILDTVGIDMILVGDSLAMVVLGHKDTKSVTVAEMLHHTKAVSRAVKNSLVIGDMPINSYDTEKCALKNARHFMKAGAHAVKIEGCKPNIAKALQHKGIKVMCHLGLLPQTAADYKVQGKDKKSAEQILKEAKILDKLNPVAIVLECIPANLAKQITENTSSPTIGIGAGPHCDGQVLVLHDMIGLFHGSVARFVKQYTSINKFITEAASRFKSDVEDSKFPTEEHSYET